MEGCHYLFRHCFCILKPNFHKGVREVLYRQNLGNFTDKIFTMESVNLHVSTKIYPKE